MRVRLVTRFFVAPFALAVVLACPRPSLADAGPACGEQLVTNGKGTAIKVLFAKNGAVQRYVVQNEQENVEDAFELRLGLEQRYGPAELNAPPMHIVSFKRGSGGLMMPAKAIDSCGRTLSFQ